MIRTDDDNAHNGVSITCVKIWKIECTVNVRNTAVTTVVKKRLLSQKAGTITLLPPEISGLPE